MQFANKRFTTLCRRKSISSLFAGTVPEISAHLSFSGQSSSSSEDEADIERADQAINKMVFMAGSQSPTRTIGRTGITDEMAEKAAVAGRAEHAEDDDGAATYQRFHAKCRANPAEACELCKKKK